jgi:3D (Asp-Asp-Asp) domain-containing protein
MIDLARDAALAALLISAAPPDAVRTVTVESTAYAPCSSGGRMANGQRPHAGAVAMNLLPLGTRIRVSRSPLGRRRAFVVSDRIGYGSQLDFWTPSCAKARAWGRRTVRVTW